MTSSREQVALTNSARMEWCRCKWRWAARYALGVVPSAPKSRALRFGSLWHELMDVLWRDGLQAAESYLDGLDAIARDAPAGLLNPQADSDTVADVSTARDLLSVYIKRHSQRHDWSVVLSEVEFELPLSSGLTLRGKIDKLVEIDGQHWLVEHKTSSRTLAEWIGEHGYIQQPQVYALGAQTLGYDVVGIIFDLVSSRPPASHVRRRKDGSPVKLPDGSLPNVTLATWRASVAGFPPEDWHDAVTRGLEARERTGHYHREEFVRFELDDLSRALRELDALSFEMTSLAEALRSERSALLGTSSSYQSTAIVAAVRCAAMSRATRNPGACWAWNRPCEYMDLCRQRSIEAAEGMEVLTNVHQELDGERKDADQGE